MDIRKIRILGIIFSVSLLLAMTVVAPVAAAPPVINRGQTYTFYDVTAGEKSGWFPGYTFTEYNLGYRYAGASSNCLSTWLPGIPSAVWAGVYKLVTVGYGQGGNFYTTVSGTYHAHLAVSGGMTAAVWFKILIKDWTLGGSLVRDYQIIKLEKKWFGSKDTGSVAFSSTTYWNGIAGHDYGIEIYVKTQVSGWVGQALADAAGNYEQGMWMSSIKVFS